MHIILENRYRGVSPVVAMLITLLLSSAIPTCAQQMWQVVFPGEATTDIATNTSIVVRAPNEIARQSVSWKYPNAESNGIVATHPTILVLENSFAQKHPRSRWNTKAVRGTYELENPATTLRYSNISLKAGTEYRCIINEVQLVNGSIVPSREFTFTTRDDVPQIVESSFDTTSAVSCKGSIKLKFNTSILPLPGPYLQKLKVKYGGTDSALPANYTTAIDIKGTTVTISPTTSWIMGSILSVSYEGGLITGNKQHNKKWSANVRAAGKATFIAVSEDGRQIPEVIQNTVANLEHAVLRNDGLSLHSPEWYNNRWQFVRWECPTLATLAEPTNSSQHVQVSCEELQKIIPVKVILKEIDTVWVKLNVDSNGRVDVYNSQHQLLTSVTNTTASIPIIGSNSSITIVAVANSGNTFQSWNATGLPSHGSTNAAITIGNTYQQVIAGNSGIHGGTFTPTFQVGTVGPNGLVPEVYRLRVQLEDYENGAIDPNESAQWFTDKVFEDVVQRDADVHVKVGKNWVILGYTNYGENEMHFFDEPVRELHEMFALLKPENIVSILVERIEARIRIDQVVLKNDISEEYYPGRTPSNEFGIIIQKEVGKTKKQWITLTSTACFDNNTPFLTTSIRLGDKIRVKVRSSRARGVEFRRWCQIPNYIIPAGAGTGESEEELLYTATVDEGLDLFQPNECGYRPNNREIRMRAGFREQFGIKQIGLRVRIRNGVDRSKAKFELRWYDPMMVFDVQDDETNNHHQLEYQPFWGTPVRIQFNEPVDFQTVYSDGMVAKVYDQVLPTDPLFTELDAEIKSKDDARINGFSSNNLGLDIVEFRIADPGAARPRPQALYDGIIDLSVSKNIKSLRGDPLLSSFNTSLYRMECPGVAFTLKSVEYKYDHDADFWPISNYGEMYHAIYGGNISDKDIELVSKTFNRIPDCRSFRAPVPQHCTMEWEDDNGAQQYNNSILSEYYFMQVGDISWIHIESFDEDCRMNDNCLVNNVYNLLDAVKTKVGQYDAGEKTIDDVRSMVPDIVEVGANFIQGLLPIEDQDEYVGSMDVLGTHPNLWGARESTYPTLEFDESDAKYRIKVQLLVSKAVLR